MVDMNCFVQVILFFFFRWNEVLRTQLVATLTKVMNFELYFFFLDKLSFISGYVLKAVCVAVNIVLKLSR